jgi:SnoaL-like domain
MPLSVADHIEIEQLIATLCQALDIGRPEEFVAAFAPDGIYQATTSVASGEQVRFRHQGPAQLLAFAEQAAAKRAGLARHWTGNLVLTGTEQGAEATSYVMFMQIDPQTRQRSITLSGVHRDRFVRTAGGWRFQQRTIVADI